MTNNSLIAFAVVILIFGGLFFFLNPSISLGILFVPVDIITGFDNGNEIPIEEIYWDKSIITYKIENVIIDKNQNLIIDGKIISKNLIKAVDRAILSTERLGENKFFGWNGALSGFSSDCFIPDRFEKIINGRPDVSVFLSTAEVQSDDNPLQNIGGKSILNSRNGIATDATILLFNIDEVSLDVAETIIRHEFGHILGLDHSDRRTDLMADSVFFSRALISQSNNADLAMKYCEVER